MGYLSNDVFFTPGRFGDNEPKDNYRSNLSKKAPKSALPDWRVGIAPIRLGNN